MNRLLDSSASEINVYVAIYYHMECTLCSTCSMFSELVAMFSHVDCCIALP
jgi:hypothetical protein